MNGMVEIKIDCLQHALAVKDMIGINLIYLEMEDKKNKSSCEICEEAFKELEKEYIEKKENKDLIILQRKRKENKIHCYLCNPTNN